MANVYLAKSRKPRLEQGHPWIYRSEIERIDEDAVPGRLVHVHTHQNKYAATGYINPESQITVRIIAYEPVEELNKAFFVRRIQAAKEHRERFVTTADSYRAVYGEADFLPGLTVDKFADQLVIQVLSLGMEVHKQLIVDALAEIYQPRGIYERSDVSVRTLEGLEQRKGPLYGEPERYVRIQENGLELQIDLHEGQKTGYFFDQRENRASIEPLMTGWGRRSGIALQDVETDSGITERRPVNAGGKVVTFPYWDGATVLECFSHTGSFTLHACKYGAKKVTCLDISEHAIESARVNVKLNGFEERVEFVVADAFDYLRAQVKGLEERRLRSGAEGKKVDTSVKMEGNAGRTWDVVILDPPAFAKSRGAVEGACRGYKEINLQGMKLVNEGGYLVTASCSYHMRPELFLETIQAAAADAGRILRLVEFRAAGKDHPRVLGVEEGHYLKFAVFQVHSRAALQ